MPRIGVSHCRKLADYLEAVQRSGGEAVVLEPDASAAEALVGLDGLVLTGGSDVDPARYGEAPHPTVVDVDAPRDAVELNLIEHALKTDLPILGICRGIQVLNVALGGSLIQDIPSQVDGAVSHRVREPANAHAHDVWLTDGSILYGALQHLMTDPGTVAVNSRHHQSIRQLGSGLQVTATAPDGVIEAVERPASRFCVGVQWHPENFWRTGEFRPLFEAFIAACKAHTR